VITALPKGREELILKGKYLFILVWLFLLMFCYRSYRNKINSIMKRQRRWCL